MTSIIPLDQFTSSTYPYTVPLIKNHHTTQPPFKYEGAGIYSFKSGDNLENCSGYDCPTIVYAIQNKSYRAHLSPIIDIPQLTNTHDIVIRLTTTVTARKKQCAQRED